MIDFMVEVHFDAEKGQWWIAPEGAVTYSADTLEELLPHVQTRITDQITVLSNKLRSWSRK